MKILKMYLFLLVIFAALPLASEVQAENRNAPSYNLEKPEEAIQPDQSYGRLPPNWKYEPQSGCQWSDGSLLGGPTSGSYSCICYDARRGKSYSGSPGECGPYPRY